MNRIQKLWQIRWLKLVVELLFVLLVLFAVRSWTQRDMIQGQVPPFKGRLLSGEIYNVIDDDRRPLLIHFWASWCPVCKFEQNSIQAISLDYPVITIAMHSGENDEVMNYMQQENLEFPVLNDPNGILAHKFGVRGIPSSFIINGNNLIEFRESGYTTEFGLRLRLWMAD